MALFADEPLRKEPIRVYLRLRPANKFELSRRSANCVSIVENNKDGGYYSAVEIESPVEGEFNFVFEEVFPEESTQEAVYQNAVAPVASYALEGFSCAVIAYGQTGSGKTHTMMGWCQQGVTKPRQSSMKVLRDDDFGMIHRAIKDIFRLMKGSPPSSEYIVRCSFVEIYMEKVLDLLNPANRSVQIVSSGPTIQLRGACEACCFDESDAISLLVRGNGCRTVSSSKMNTYSRSHAAFVIRIEQKDSNTGISRMSQVLMVDMAGSELSVKGDIISNSTFVPIHQEAMMINESLSLLNTITKTVVENQSKRGGICDIPYENSKLTHLLKDAFGGNCHTSVILTASPSSYNITESLRTMKFGHTCQSVTNFVAVNVELSPYDYRKLLNDFQKKQEDLTHLVSELSAECFQLKESSLKQNFVGSHHTGPLWKTIERVLSDGVTSVASDTNRTRGKEELKLPRSELCISKQGRVNIENRLAERLSEVAVLRTQIDKYASEQKRNQRELVSVKNDLQVITQRKQEVEHNLRTSQFREYEATVFLRQFRRFYRRLLRNKALQGTGRTSDVIGRVPGVPDLNDLIDIDSLLLEAGLIEESELHDDAATGAYRPSAQALSRSTEATNKAWRQAACHGEVDALESFDHSFLVGPRQVGQLITNRQQFLSTPSGRLAATREKELERDLLRATEKCIELQMALNEEKANVDILTNKTGNINRKKFAQESHQLKQQLDKKTHDLQAIIWKMNELHLINKTYNEKMSNREQHVTYLEENLVELQGSTRNMILERNEAEEIMRAELDNLKVLMDAMTVPIWQFGECAVMSQPLSSRVYLPVCSDVLRCGESTDSEGLESLESLEEISSEVDDRSEQEHKQDSPGICLQDASTQTFISCKIGHQNDSPSMIFEAHCTPLVTAVATDNQNSITKVEQNNNSISHVGGKPVGSLPRRFVHKFGFMLRPGVLKESQG